MSTYPIITQKNLLYEHLDYLVKETKKPVYLDFYELEEADFMEARICCYLKQTIRYKGKWFFVTTRKQYYRIKSARDAAPKILIKYLYKKPIPFQEDKNG